MVDKKKKRSDFQRRFISGFTGSKVGLKRPDIQGQDQSDEAKARRKKMRDAKKRRR